MKLLVTGGLGFIGSNFILNILKKTNYEILNLDAKKTGSDVFNLRDIQNNSKYTFVEGNICDKKLVETLVDKCDYIVNFAAESHVDRSISEPKPFLDSNVYGVFNILETIKKNRKKFLQISTDEVYGTIQKGSSIEESRFNPSNPYSATKASAELLINSYNTTYDLDVSITRCTNNYGPRQFFEKLIPKSILLLKQNKKIPVYGDGTSIRDWIHVDDHCDAILKVITKGKSGTSYNISANNEIKNIEVIQKILTILNKSSQDIEYVSKRPGEDIRYSLDSSKIRNELGWAPKITFEKGLHETVDWYLQNMEFIHRT